MKQVSVFHLCIVRACVRAGGWVGLSLPGWNAIQFLHMAYPPSTFVLLTFFTQWKRTLYVDIMPLQLPLGTGTYLIT